MSRSQPIGVALLLLATNAWSQIYTCVDATGRKLTSDRPIAECSTRDQRLLNADGSVRRIVPPTMTAEERADFEAAERQKVADAITRQDAVRRDRNLMVRFPNEAAHQKFRKAALDDVRGSVEASEKRMAALAAERKPLNDEAEFYAGRQMPGKLRAAIDANDAATEAQRTLIQNQKAEAVRINALFDAELARLKRLWGGAAPGSMGTLAVSAAVSAAVGASVATPGKPVDR